MKSPCGTGGTVGFGAVGVSVSVAVQLDEVFGALIGLLLTAGGLCFAATEVTDVPGELRTPDFGHPALCGFRCCYTDAAQKLGTAAGDRPSNQIDTAAGARSRPGWCLLCTICMLNMHGYSHTSSRHLFYILRCHLIRSNSNLNIIFYTCKYSIYVTRSRYYAVEAPTPPVPPSLSDQLQQQRRGEKAD